jgi:hypothetical protein
MEPPYGYRQNEMIQLEQLVNATIKLIADHFPKLARLLLHIMLHIGSIDRRKRHGPPLRDSNELIEARHRIIMGTLVAPV